MKKLLARKKNNKGFSLVELIVVILIMAIIAVALAPQVMKWVGESSKSTDASNIATIKSAASTAVADYMQKAKTASAPASVYKVDATNKTLAKVAGGDETLTECIKEVMNGDYPAVKEGKGDFYIIISTTGQVTVEKSESAPTLPPTPTPATP